MPGSMGQAGSVIVVIPTYNESPNMGSIINRLAALPIPNLKLVIVDDSSPDGTAEEAERVGATLADTRPEFVTVVRRTTKDGLGRAYVAGMTVALAMGADLLVQMDADLSHQPEYVPAMITKLIDEDADVVIGSRYVPGGSLADDWKLHRRLLSGWANFYVNAILGLKVRDATAGFKVWRAPILDKIGLDKIRSNGYSFQVEMNYVAQRLGGKIVEYPIHFHERESGFSKMSLGVKIESAKLPLRLRWSKGR
jgi:dolichol-phosphate mannosyltransferase